VPGSNRSGVGSNRGFVARTEARRARARGFVLRTETRRARASRFVMKGAMRRIRIEQLAIRIRDEETRNRTVPASNRSEERQNRRFVLRTERCVTQTETSRGGSLGFVNRIDARWARTFAFVNRIEALGARTSALEPRDRGLDSASVGIRRRVGFGAEGTRTRSRPGVQCRSLKTWSTARRPRRGLHPPGPPPRLAIAWQGGGSVKDEAVDGCIVRSPAAHLMFPPPWRPRRGARGVEFP